MLVSHPSGTTILYCLCPIILSASFIHLVYFFSCFRQKGSSGVSLLHLIRNSSLSLYNSGYWLTQLAKIELDYNTESLKYRVLRLFLRSAQIGVTVASILFSRHGKYSCFIRQCTSQRIIISKEA